MDLQTQIRKEILNDSSELIYYDEDVIYLDFINFSKLESGTVDQIA